MTEWYAVITFETEVYSTHDNVWSARETYFDLDEGMRRYAKVVKLSIVEEIDVESLSLT